MAVHKLWTDPQVGPASGGPSCPVPIFNSLTVVNIGGTQRVINVMHTPLALTVGINL